VTVSKPLRLFKFYHDGTWTFGISVVVAHTKQQAVKLLKARLLELKLATDELDCEEIDISQSGVHVLCDGVY
jgi:hypothetical protein